MSGSVPALPGRTDRLRVELHAEQALFARALHDCRAAVAEGRAEAYDAVAKLMSSHDRLAALTYQLRAVAGAGDPLLEAAEDYLATASQSLVARQVSRERRFSYQRWVTRYRGLWRAHLPLFAFTATLFLASIAAGWLVGRGDTGLATVVVSQGMVEKVIDREAWFNTIQKSPLLDGLSIAYNNIRVCINTFLGGALLGLGGLLLVIYNGLMIGSIFGLCYANGFHDQLGRFILSHGPLELSIIVASGFTSLHFGRTFYMRPLSRLRERLGRAAREAGVLVSGILPWLVLAATLEAYVSPWPQIPGRLKLALGLVAAVAFWAWTFWPVPKAEESLAPSGRAASPRRSSRARS